MSLPKSFELPEPEDFCRGQLFHGSSGKACFTGWRIKLLPNVDFDEEVKFEEEAVKVAKQMRLKAPKYLVGGYKVPASHHYNDCEENSPRRLATWFRKTIERMGYDVS